MTVRVGPGHFICGFISQFFDEDFFRDGKMIFFFRAVWGLGTFSLDPFAVSFSRRQPSNEDVFTANVLYFCNLSFKRCYNESPLRFLFSLS